MKESTLKYFTANSIYKKNNKKENINFEVFLSGIKKQVKGQQFNIWLRNFLLTWMK
ncbi:hypothetical protein [Lactococcus lactis]|uniref:hypothetical protein n=1 Tax=Lactococcus lactis TaxID=1358 RepID=UPI001372E356|nr:hypothetical protein [Lactococcus lactis]